MNEKEKREKKKGPLVQVGVINRNQRWSFIPDSGLPDLGIKDPPFSPRLAMPVGKTEEKEFPNRDKSRVL